jgi:hypothetical protein
MAAQPRTRHEVHPAIIAVLRPLLRFSPSRNAYVLRGVGSSRGPVLRSRTRARTNHHTPHSS